MRKLLLLSAAALLAGAANAQVSEPTLTQDWKSTENIPAVAGARWGAGYGGNVYVQDRGVALYCYTDDNNGGATRTSVTDLVAAGSGVAFDSKGNALLSNGWAGGGAMRTLVLYNATTGAVSNLDITNDITTLGYTAGRMDYIGRGAGDIFSVEGGAFFFAAQNQTAILKVFIAEGALVPELCAVIEGPATADNLTVVVPLTEDPESNDIAVRIRGSRDFYYYTGSKWVAYSRPDDGNIKTTAGGDVVTLGDVLFTIEPAGDTYLDGWQIVERATNSLVKSVAAMGTTNATGSATVLCAQKISETKAYIYHYHPGQFVARYTFEIPEGYKDYVTAIETVEVDANAPVEYYNLQGVKVANPESGLFIKKQGSKTTKVVL